MGFVIKKKVWRGAVARSHGLDEKGKTGATRNLAKELGLDVAAPFSGGTRAAAAEAAGQPDLTHEELIASIRSR